ncbi:MAG: hypothetical protein HYR96_09750 [Deltaproteobacteria bacterium]|nr:hypothetical protein [Deltaproteobacteria bacterium]
MRILLAIVSLGAVSAAWSDVVVLDRAHKRFLVGYVEPKEQLWVKSCEIVSSGELPRECRGKVLLTIGAGHFLKRLSSELLPEYTNTARQPSVIDVSKEVDRIVSALDNNETLDPQNSHRELAVLKDIQERLIFFESFRNHMGSKGPIRLEAEEGALDEESLRQRMEEFQKASQPTPAKNIESLLSRIQFLRSAGWASKVFRKDDRLSLYYAQFFLPFDGNGRPDRIEFPVLCSAWCLNQSMRVGSRNYEGPYGPIYIPYAVPNSSGFGYTGAYNKTKWEGSWNGLFSDQKFRSAQDAQIAADQACPAQESDPEPGRQENFSGYVKTIGRQTNRVSCKNR